MDCKTVERALNGSRKHWVSELLALACCVTALPAAAASLCAPDEPVVFACQVGTKIVSLCRPAQGEGMLSYRFGRPAALELRYPAPGRLARSAFTVSTTPLVGGGETTVAFERGGFSYTVYSRVARGADGVTPEFEDGLVVRRRGKVVSRLRCEDGGEGFREPLIAPAMK